MNNASEQSGQLVDAPPVAFERPNTLARPKGNIDPPIVVLLMLVACIPLILVLARIIALPGVSIPAFFEFSLLKSLGTHLNQSFAFEWIPPTDRSTVLYILLLPTGALIVSLFRLTLGLRILGFRAILIAIGFQEAGVVPSLLLLGFVVGLLLVIRPSMRRIRLPLFSRISIILCLTAMVMASALLLAPIVRSEILWSVAFFPVIIVAMMAEGIARTVAKDNAVTAIWRASWTLMASVVFAFVSTRTSVRFGMIHFPELMLTQLICIVLISEYFDFRLLEQWPNRLSRMLEGQKLWRTDKPVVAVVHNRWNRGVIGRLGTPAPSKYRKRSVQPAVDALRDEGFMVKVYEGDITLLSELHKLIPPNPMTRAPGGIVFNLATGVQGSGRFCQIPAMLELAGVAFTGPDPVAQANMLDRYVLLTLLSNADIAVPQFVLSSAMAATINNLEYPVSVRARREPDESSIKVRNFAELEAAVEQVQQSTGLPALLEERIAGREIRVCLIGNGELECLPILERRPTRQPRKQCPAKLDDSDADRLRETAFKAFNASGCRDYARIDLRLTDDGQPIVIDVKWDGVLIPRGSFARAAEAAGYSYARLLHRIIDTAAVRYGARPASTAMPSEATEFSTWLPGKRVNAQ